MAGASIPLSLGWQGFGGRAEVAGGLPTLGQPSRSQPVFLTKYRV